MTGGDPAALAAADAVAAALHDPRQVRFTHPEGGRVWPQSLAGGAAGIALLHCERAQTGRGDPRLAHAWLTAATAGAVTAADNAGLYFGTPAVGFAVHAAAGPSGQYRRALAGLDQAVTRLTTRRLAAAWARLEAARLPDLREFDLVRGLTGLGAYHLAHQPDSPITQEVLSYLVRLTQLLPASDLPGWWVEVSPNGEPHPDYPSGHGNLGLAHGIGAALALLSLAVLRDLQAPGTMEAIERICAWTDQWRQHDDVGPWWPGILTIDQSHERDRSHRQCHPHLNPGKRPRPGWCYGMAGTARAQQLAGLALGDTARQQVAETAMVTTLRTPSQLDRLTEIGLCHGIAGLIQAAWRMAADGPSPQIAAELAHLTNRLIAQLTTQQARRDPELLDGAAGAALALHTVGTGTAPVTSWDAILVLA